MRHLLTACAVLALIGCGGADDGLTSDERALQGTWVLDGQNGCAALAAFDDHAIALGAACSVTATSANMQVDRGTFTASGGRISATFSESSCPRTGVSWAPSFTVSGGMLTLLEASGATALTRLPASGPAGGSVTYGCFLDDGSFVESPIRPVP